MDTLELGDDTLGPEVSERRITLIALGALLRLQLAPVEDERAATRLCSIVEPWTVRLVCSARYPIYSILYYATRLSKEKVASVLCLEPLPLLLHVHRVRIRIRVRARVRETKS